MPIFVIFRVANAPKMEAALQQTFPNDYLKVSIGEYLVSSPGTAKELSDRLMISPATGGTGPAMVFSMANYYGRASTEIWDWIKTKAESTGG